MPPFNKKPPLHPSRKAPRRNTKGFNDVSGIALNASKERSVFGHPTHLDVLAAKMLLPYGVEKQVPEGTVIRDMSAETIAANNRYLVEKPSELFLNGQYNAQNHVARNLVDFEAVLSGAYEQGAVQGPIKLGLYGVAKAQMIFIECIQNLLYKRMPEEELRGRAETDARRLERDASRLAAALNPTFVSAPADLGLTGLAQYRRLLATIVAAKADAAARAAAAAAAAKAAENAAKADAKKAEVDAFVRNFMAPKPKPIAPPSPPPAPPSEPWYTQVARAMQFVPRVAGGTRKKQKRSRKVE